LIVIVFIVVVGVAVVDDVGGADLEK